MTIELPMITDAGCCAPMIGAPRAAPHATDLAKMFKALGDPIRLRLLSLITSASDETCVCDLGTAFDVTGPTISITSRCSAKPASSKANAAAPGSTTGPSTPPSATSPTCSTHLGSYPTDQRVSLPGTCTQNLYGGRGSHRAGVLVCREAQAVLAAAAVQR